MQRGPNPFKGKRRQGKEEITVFQILDDRVQEILVSQTPLVKMRLLEKGEICFQEGSPSTLIRIKRRCRSSRLKLLLYLKLQLR